MIDICAAGSHEQVKEMTQHPAAGAAAAYIQSVRLLECAIEGSVVEHLQKDMAARRQADRSIGGQQFHIWLSVCLFPSRLKCLTSGPSTLAFDCS